MLKHKKMWLGGITGATVLMLTLGSVTPALAATPAAAKKQAASYQLDVAGQETTLGEGDAAVYPMVPVSSGVTKGTASTDVVYPGDGSGTLTVTASKGVYHYKIAMHVPATNFVGTFHVTDLTSGLSGGRVLELVFAGSITTSKHKGHRYSGTLTGTAEFAGVSVAKVGPNATIYHYTDY